MSEDPGREPARADTRVDAESADAVARWTADLAVSVGQLLLGYFRRTDLDSQLKSDFSLVTEADLAADRMIEEAVTSAFPGDAIISEEANTGYDAACERVWIIDPIDGTTNFSHGMQHWGVSIACIRRGVPWVAALFCPALGELYVAHAGGGTTLNGHPAHVAAPLQEGRWRVMACCSRTLRYYNVNLPMKMRVLGCATYSLASVARGSAALAFETRPKIWDLAAVWLLVTEAGGVVRAAEDPQPFPLQTGVPYGEISYPLLAAATPELLQTALEGIALR